jgi:hypothetical protein
MLWTDGINVFHEGYDLGNPDLTLSARAEPDLWRVVQHGDACLKKSPEYAAAGSYCNRMMS